MPAACYSFCMWIISCLYAPFQKTRIEEEWNSSFASVPSFKVYSYWETPYGEKQNKHNENQCYAISIKNQMSHHTESCHAWKKLWKPASLTRANSCEICRNVCYFGKIFPEMSLAIAVSALWRQVKFASVILLLLGTQLSYSEFHLYVERVRKYKRINIYVDIQCIICWEKQGKQNYCFQDHSYTAY